MKLIKLLQRLHDSRDHTENPDLAAHPEKFEPVSDDTALMNDELRQLAQHIRRMPDLEPPPSLLSSVMETLHQQRRSWWRRAHEWVKSPRSFSLSYLQVAVGVAVLLLAPSLATYYLGTQGARDLSRIHQPARIPVEFSLHLPQAHSVAVIGSFNDWHPQGYQMRETAKGHGTWTLTLWLGAGRYQYSFLVNGHRIMPDPRSSFNEEDGFGNQNAVLIVGNGDDKTI